MAARSVTELLPRPFAELTIDDALAIIEAVGEERESLFFERKSAVTPESLAKSCAAFANTAGGLLLVGVADQTEDLPGIEQPAGEIQVWVKDVLRSRLLPMPPFRARWIPLGDDPSPGLMLVLVEESSTTPHLLSRQGAIYVRNPGSSDPVPISDQGRLLGLLERGANRRNWAIDRAIGAAASHGFWTTARQTLALVPTGVSATFEEAIFSPAGLQFLRDSPWEHTGHPREVRVDIVTQDALGAERRLYPQFRGMYAVCFDAIKVWRDGALIIHRGDVEAPEHENPLTEGSLREVFARMLAMGREALLRFGAHGDVCLSYQVELAPRGLEIQNRIHEQPGQILISGRWSSLETDERRDEELIASVFDEFARALGHAPPSTTA